MSDSLALLPIFNALPGAYLLLSPALVIEAVSDDYLAATLTQRTDLLGRYLFDAFPDSPRAPAARGGHHLRASLQQVLATGQPHEMALQHYDVPDPAAPGQFVERHWRPRNSPVLGEQGQVRHLIHAVVEVTQEVLVVEQLLASRVYEQDTLAAAEGQRQQLYTTLQEAPAMICVFDGPQHVFQFVNPPYQALVGARPLVGMPIAQAMPELAGQPIFDLLDSVYQTGETFQASEMLVQLDHDNVGMAELEKRYYNFIYKARRNPTGAIDGIFVFAYEVTTQVLARQQVQTLNEELAAANEELIVANEEFLQTNTALTRTQQQVQQLNAALEMRVAERTQQLQESLREAQQQREALRQQQRLLRQILGQLPAAIATLSGPTHQYSFFNDSHQLLSGQRAVLGQTMAEVFPEVVAQGFVDLLDQVYITGQAYRGVEVPAQLYDATTGQPEQRYIDFIYQPLSDDKGQTDNILAFILDTTDKVLARQQVEQSRTQVQDLNEELATINEELQATNEEFATTNYALTRTNADLDNFIYTASHDLKEPINNLGGLLEALQEQLPPEAQQAELVQPLLDMMWQAVGRFQKTIAHLTDISKLQQAYTQPAEVVDLATLVREVCLDLTTLLADTGAQLTVEVATCPTVAFSARNLRSIVYNLLSNAIKYHHPARLPVVQLRCHSTSSTVVLEVQDNGLGLEAAQQAKLFGMFERLHDHVEGSGIGLYMVKKIVDNAGGSIAVQSQPGVGSTFNVTLPR
ncbi:MAG: PAS domain-containing protein [Janthinobacterium lividum]